MAAIRQRRGSCACGSRRIDCGSVAAGRRAWRRGGPVRVRAVAAAMADLGRARRAAWNFWLGLCAVAAVPRFCPVAGSSHADGGAELAGDRRHVHLPLGVRSPSRAVRVPGRSRRRRGRDRRHLRPARNDRRSAGLAPQGAAFEPGRAARLRRRVRHGHTDEQLFPWTSCRREGRAMGLDGLDAAQSGFPLSPCRCGSFCT